MMRAFCLLFAADCLLATPAVAQFVPPPPELEYRIPAPLPPPPEPPIINGPYGQGPAPGVAKQRRLKTFSNRATRCLQQGADYGLRGGELDAYTRGCANAQ